MPLKKPKELPKIPKTRKKKLENALNAIPEPKPDKLEYICKAYYDTDEFSGEQKYVISVETIAEFTSFSYEITVETMQKKNEIYIVLMGLSAKTNMVPGIQSAKTKIEFDNLYGEHTVNIVKQDGCINSGLFNFNIFKREIELIKEFIPEKENNRSFCKFIVDEENFSFKE